MHCPYQPRQWTSVQLQGTTQARTLTKKRAQRAFLDFPQIAVSPQEGTATPIVAVNELQQLNRTGITGIETILKKIIKKHIAEFYAPKFLREFMVS